MGSAHLAIDLGAESGRAFVGRIAGTIELTEIGRFRNIPLSLPDRTCWNVGGILQFILDSLAAAGDVDSLSIDAWGVDFGLLRGDGSLLAPPRCYRDPLNAGMLAPTFARIPRADLYEQTGIQMMEINTSCQLLALAQKRPQELAQAETLLMIPDLLRYWLGGEPVAERTNASTTQLLRPDGTWATDVFAALGVDAAMMPRLAESNQVVGTTAAGIPIIAGPSHDTAAAVVGAPLREGAAFLSCGTWSLVGMELPGPVLNEVALGLNLSNEQGVGGTTRLLRNVMGLWLLQECRRGWTAADGHPTEYSELTAMAAADSGEPPLVDPDDPAFLRPADMEAAIQAYCATTGQPAPGGRGAIVRCVIASLALRYRWVIEALERATGRKVGSINLVGGGSQNQLLCQATADACGVPVEAGPHEATVLGNLVVQAIAAGDVGDVAEGRELIRRSFPTRAYQPGEGSVWESRYRRFCELGPATARPGRQAE